jgi:hypothetical protein
VAGPKPVSLGREVFEGQGREYIYLVARSQDRTDQDTQRRMVRSGRVDKDPCSRGIVVGLRSTRIPQARAQLCDEESCSLLAKSADAAKWSRSGVQKNRDCFPSAELRASAGWKRNYLDALRMTQGRIAQNDTRKRERRARRPAPLSENCRILILFLFSSLQASTRWLTPAG